MNIPSALRPANIGRVAVTALVVAAALYAGRRLWNFYEVEPWTRDGRVRAYVVQVAPDVSGLVTSVPVHDNQDVKAGDVLFEIDPSRFELALRQAQTAVEQAQAAVVQARAAERAQAVARDQARRDLARSRSLGDLVAAEQVEQTAARVEQSEAALAEARAALARGEAAVAQARVQFDTARLNLARCRVVAAADGRVTNLDLRVGAYAAAGHPVLAVVDAGSFYVEGYFEETKLPRIHEGSPARVTLMGDRRVLDGHVDSIALGIADRDRGTGANLLPNVNPTFNWVRLAQRIPVRVKLDRVPEGVRLVAGQTATVVVGDGASAPARTSAADPGPAGADARAENRPAAARSAAALRPAAHPVQARS
ncbi:HlyD family secretion protein [Pigmentiphaga soli]|uniref:HlyD family secretion protein n=1 Tax=Pigmentiphaga soli TaxID=1007095 RepID=A0ABP8HQS2_9BURK